MCHIGDIVAIIISHYFFEFKNKLKRVGIMEIVNSIIYNLIIIKCVNKFIMPLMIQIVMWAVGVDGGLPTRSISYGMCKDL